MLITPLFPPSNNHTNQPTSFVASFPSHLLLRFLLTASWPLIMYAINNTEWEMAW